MGPEILDGSPTRHNIQIVPSLLMKLNQEETGSNRVEIYIPGYPKRRIDGLLQYSSGSIVITQAHGIVTISHEITRDLSGLSVERFETTGDPDDASPQSHVKILKEILIPQETSIQGYVHYRVTDIGSNIVTDDDDIPLSDIDSWKEGPAHFIASTLSLLKAEITDRVKERDMNDRISFHTRPKARVLPEAFLTTLLPDEKEYLDEIISNIEDPLTFEDIFRRFKLRF